jgi:hypothetical protein
MSGMTSLWIFVLCQAKVGRGAGPGAAGHTHEEISPLVGTSRETSTRLL